MSKRPKFEIIYAPIIKVHLRAIAAKYYSLIRDAIELRLRIDPDTETRNRKPLKRPSTFGATWELRFGPDNCFRVLYKVNLVDRQVEVLAIGEKKGERFMIGGEEIEL